MRGVNLCCEACFVVLVDIGARTGTVSFTLGRDVGGSDTEGWKRRTC